MAIIVNPTAAEFKQMLAEKKTFLADFYATWCGPCKMLSYVLEDIAKEMGERIDIVKIDIDKEPELTEEMDITISSVSSGSLSISIFTISMRSPISLAISSST